MADESSPAPAPPRVQPPSRRAFFARLAALLSAVATLGRHLAAPHRAEASRAAPLSAQPNATVLAALASAILPGELGEDGTRRAVGDFQRWMGGYRPGAEANHGYGTGTLQRLPADPRPRWRAQLQALDGEARRVHGGSFASLTRDARQAVVRTALGDVRAESLPTPLTAPHVALALLAHFYDSPAAIDLCYEASIGRQQCRPLNAGRQQPVPITRRRR